MIDRPERLNELSPGEKRALVAELLRKELDAAVDAHPLSYGQQAMWFLYQLAPESAAYNVSFTARIRSTVDASILRRALQVVIDRHQPLRTTFNSNDGKPVQLVHRRCELPLVEMDVAGLDDQALYERVLAAYKEPFDLENGPVLRARLFTRADDDHVLLLAAHHIVLDGWATWILLDELFTSYAAEASGSPVNLPSLNVEYSDFVRWQRELVAGPAGEQMWEYWRTQLAGELPTLALPADRPRPPAQTFNGATVEFTLVEELTEAVKALARDEQTTVYTVLLAAFQSLLHRYGGQQDVIVGSPMAGRSRPEFAPLVGDFINMVALRADFSGAPSFRTILSQVRETVLDALQHQDFPFPLLVNRLAPAPDPSRSPIFQVAFDLQRIQRVGELTELLIPGKQGARAEVGGLVLEPYPMPQQEGQLDLTLQLVEAGGAFHGAVKYNTDLFDAETVERMIGHYRTLLEAAVNAPERSVSRLPMLTATERQQLLVDWNATDVAYPTGSSLHGLIEEQVLRTPGEVAVAFGAETLTYRELDLWAERVARQLRELGVGPGTLTAVCLERSLELPVAILGVLKAGGAYVPLDPAYPRERLAFMLKDSRAPVLVTKPILASQIPTSHQRVLMIDSRTGPVTASGPPPPVSTIRPEDAAYVIYTSGSTGTPKGVVISHQAIINHMRWFIQEFQLGPSDRVLQKTPYSFDASVWEFFAPLLVGGQLIMARPDGHRDVEYLINAIQEYGITVLQLVPSLLGALLADSRFGGCHTLRHVFCGGEELTPELQTRFFAAQSAVLTNLYGPTEATIDATFWTCDPSDDRKPIPIGRPIHNVRTYVLDTHLQPVPVGVVGELYLGGIGLSNGYLHQAELTAERFIPDPFSNDPGERLYRTGDLVRYRDDGALVFVGRQDFQVKLRGFRIELGEIEAVLGQYPGIREAVVLARADGMRDPKLVAYFSTQDGVAPTPRELRTFLKGKLPEYMVPAAFVPLDALPLTNNGKVDRAALPAPSQQRADLGDGYVAPQTPTERAIANIWSDVLGVDRVGVYDNFFDLGGQSLQIVEVLAAIEESLGLRINPGLAQYQTLGQLAAICDEMVARGEVRKPKASESTTGKVMSAMRRMLGAAQRQDL